MSNQFFSPEGDIEDYFVTEYWLIDQYIGDQLWGWGANTNTQLGINASTNRSTPVTTLTGGTNWKQVSGIVNHTAAIKTDGTLWTWGDNASGQLGNATILDRSTPVTVFGGGTNWRQVSVANNFTAAIKTDGTLWIWGSNTYAQLGINATGNRFTPVTTFTGGTNWKQVSHSSGNQIAAIKTDGTLWTWGRNSNGQLGINATGNRSTPVTVFGSSTNWKQVSGGTTHFAATKTDGTLWVWGLNSSGQLGINDTITKSTPVTVFGGGTNWKDVRCSADNTNTIKTDGTLWVWGSGSDGALGTNDTITRFTPVTTFAGGTNWKQIGGGAVAIKTDGTLWTWGLNASGQCGVNDTISRLTPVTTFLGRTDWKQTSGGPNSRLAVTSGISADLPLS